MTDELKVSTMDPSLGSTGATAELSPGAAAAREAFSAQAQAAAIAQEDAGFLEAATDPALAAPASVAGYAIPPPPAGVEHLPMGELRPLLGVFREAGVNVTDAREILGAIYRGRAGSPPTDADFELARRRGLADLERREGQKRAAMIVEVAQAGARRLTAHSPLIAAALSETLAGSDPAAVYALYRAERLHRARRG